MNRPRVAAWTAAAVLLLHVPAAAQSAKFKVRLFWVPIDTATAANVAGSGSATAELTGTRLSIAGTFQGLRSPATIARLHRGVRMGVRGPSIADLTVARATSGAVSGSVQLTPAQVEDLKKGNLYLQIHSEKAPDGNLWGWLLQ
jgi:hypothetical protein